MSILKTLRQKLDDKTMSAVELTTTYLKEIKHKNNLLNAFISVNETKALAHAKEMDDLITKGKATLLTGIPIAHKDNLCTDILTTTCGSKILSNYQSPFNATVVDKLKNQGMTLLGKTNMDEFGMGSTNEHSFFGVVKNPYDLHHVPGGSSGGSAAVVAAGLTPFATGSDTGGSVRQPASFCGITGIKPSYGTLSRYGLVAYGSSFDQVGILAHYAEDCAYLLQAMAGKDKKDGTSIPTDPDFFTKSLQQDLTNLTIGIDGQLLSKLSAEAQTLFQACIAVYQKQGAKIKDIQLPDLQAAVSSYYVLAPAEAATNLARFDGVRYGYRSQHANTLDELYIKSRTEGFGAEVKRRIVIGNYVLAASQYDAYYHKAQQVRAKLKQDLDMIYQNVDMILLPTAATTAPKLGAQKDPVTTYLSDMYTLIANLTGAPAISFPIGQIEHMPFGAQLMANNFQDHLLLQAVCAFQRQTAFHLPQQLLQGVNA
ncbi:MULTISPECIES: Asp-tRNA(Asn)/Glu-tRNA(Gln) amidotransferase subunit GatA [Cysteiniphilum]|uniref:Glutamyl-tRNA(Gln) amidotransferase subunit A n=1 Tax=Cysteiniphilum litorale TaxID=2056700 RepID=A0A8J2Z2F7_9GAMM|nr:MULTISPECIES: Asp-tRNA(Asn)/Glu-tRNA(Gln) amidotransferase subunit GatA [Cysteiniphilum]GGF89632.1 glutamyl-tRNA(Gln) amidotransferase subunit A [Cysteiniphilum litorale]